MKRLVLYSMLFAALPAVIVGQTRRRLCIEEPITTMTRWGGNERIEIDMRDKPVRDVNGIVMWLDDRPSDDSLVQVFSRRPSDPRIQASADEHGVPMAACRTGADGLFAFSLPPGEYELRVSLDKGIDVSSVLISFAVNGTTCK
jgi:hypothetical protein